ncbi:MAG TPA: DUF6350 family protein [Cryobacterium sp.]|nr:DUF6350 family protein [Cryobacterium sp.]
MPISTAASTPTRSGFGPTSAGAMGPGRLADVGPNPLLVGVLAAVEIGIGAGLGMISPVAARREVVGSSER